MRTYILVSFEVESVIANLNENISVSFCFMVQIMYASVYG